MDYIVKKFAVDNNYQPLVDVTDAVTIDKRNDLFLCFRETGLPVASIDYTAKRESVIEGSLVPESAVTIKKERYQKSAKHIQIGETVAFELRNPMRYGTGKLSLITPKEQGCYDWDDTWRISDATINQFGSKKTEKMEWVEVPMKDCSFQPFDYFEATIQPLPRPFYATENMATI